MVAKYTKYFFFIVLTMFGLFFNSELFQLHANSFQDEFYRADFAMDFSKSNAGNKVVLEDFISAGERHDVNFFMTDFELNGVNSKKIKIFATKGSIKALEAAGIHNGSFDSLLMGTTNIEVDSIKRIKRITSYESCYFTDGTKKLAAMRKFKADLVDKYGGGFPHQYGSPNETFLNFAALWSLLIILLLLIFSYSIVSEKKELTVSVILGVDPVVALRKRILIDAVFFIGAYIFCRLFMSRSIYVGFMRFETDMIFCAMVLLNCLTIRKLGKINFRKDLGRSKDGGGILKTNYILIFFVTVISSIVLAGNISVIRTGLNVHSQQDFFKQHKDYSFFNLCYKADPMNKHSYDKDKKMNWEFYKSNFSGAIQLMDCCGNRENIYPTIVVNKYALKEIILKNPRLKHKIRHNKDRIYVYHPKGIARKSPEFNVAIQWNPENFQNEELQSRIRSIQYDTHINVVGISDLEDTLRSTLYHDPIIIYDSALPVLRNEGEYLINGSGTMIKVPDSKYLKFIKKHNLEDQIANKINVWSWYKSEKTKWMRSSKLSAVLALLIFILELFYIFSIVRMEYRVNGVEHALGKVLGYSLYQRNRKVFSVVIVASVLGTLFALLLNKFLNMDENICSLLIGGGILLASEIVILISNIIRMEKRRIANILKGQGF